MDDLAMLSALRERLVNRHVAGVSNLDLSQAWAALGDELRRRIGSELAAGMSDADLRGFARCRDAGGDIAGWLKVHLPGHERIVAVETHRLLDDCADWFALRQASGIG
jgi:hypothetical protein